MQNTVTHAAPHSVVAIMQYASAPFTPNGTVAHQCMKHVFLCVALTCLIARPLV